MRAGRFLGCRRKVPFSSARQTAGAHHSSPRQKQLPKQCLPKGGTGAWGAAACIPSFSRSCLLAFHKYYLSGARQAGKQTTCFHVSSLLSLVFGLAVSGSNRHFLHPLLVEIDWIMLKVSIFVLGVLYRGQHCELTACSDDFSKARKGMRSPRTESGRASSPSETTHSRKTQGRDPTPGSQGEARKPIHCEIRARFLGLQIEKKQAGTRSLFSL